MNTLIFKTYIESQNYFKRVRTALNEMNKIEDCTIDLDDFDKVLRVLSESFTIAEVEKEISGMGFYCKELED
jgi:hypothetical protein